MTKDAGISEPDPRASATKVRDLNDALRTAGCGGRIVVTAGIAALPPEPVASILAAVARFDAFNADNDSYAEHDCACLTAAGHDVLWKIDTYDLALAGHSPNPADPSVTTRVLTIMLAEEY